jgi:alkylated DNA repair dioxygenase AlkB
VDTLFQTLPKLPSGFNYIPEFLDAAEEGLLKNEILRHEVHTFKFQGFEARRKVASFGYNYSFENKRLTPGEPIPSPFNFLIAKVASEIGIGPQDFKELLITEYPAGSVINWHRDAFPFDIIAGVSLDADCQFMLRPHDKQKQGRGSTLKFTVARRSLYVMQGEARTAWEHSIAPVKSVRYSITLRTLRQS